MNGTVLVTSSESSNNSSTFHCSEPLASLKGHVATSDNFAILKTSLEFSDDS